MTITLKELSRHLGLSKTTVSRALNGYPEVSEATRLRVMSAARDLGYSPNPRARGLATGRAMTIGHVQPSPSRAEVLNPVFGDFLAGAGAVYSRRGYGVHISFAEAGDEAAHYAKLVRHRLVDAVVVHAPRDDDPRLGALVDLGLPFAVHGRSDGFVDAYTYVDMDNFGVLRLATDHLLGLGHRRIALLNGPADLNFSARRLDGFHSALSQAGIAAVQDWISHAAMTEAHGYLAAGRMLAGSPRPTAFVTASILVALGVQRAVLEAGLRPGRDVSVVTHDDVLSYLPNHGDPPGFTATRSAVGDAGALLATLLLDRVEDPSLPPAQAVVRTDLVLGQSSGPAPVLIHDPDTSPKEDQT